MIKILLLRIITPPLSKHPHVMTRTYRTDGNMISWFYLNHESFLKDAGLKYASVIASVLAQQRIKDGFTIWGNLVSDHGWEIVRVGVFSALDEILKLQAPTASSFQ